MNKKVARLLLMIIAFYSYNVFAIDAGSSINGGMNPSSGSGDSSSYWLSNAYSDEYGYGVRLTVIDPIDGSPVKKTNGQDSSSMDFFSPNWATEYHYYNNGQCRVKHCANAWSYAYVGYNTDISNGMQPMWVLNDLIGGRYSLGNLYTNNNVSTFFPELVRVSGGKLVYENSITWLIQNMTGYTLDGLKESLCSKNKNTEYIYIAIEPLSLLSTGTTKYLGTLSEHIQLIHYNKGNPSDALLNEHEAVAITNPGNTPGDFIGYDSIYRNPFYTKYINSNGWGIGFIWISLEQIGLSCDVKCDYSLDNAKTSCSEKDDNVGTVQQTTDWECIFKTSNKYIESVANNKEETKNDATNYNYFYEKNGSCEMMCREEIQYDFPNNEIYVEQGTYFTAGEQEAFTIVGKNDKAPNWAPITLTATKECRITSGGNSDECLNQISSKEKKGSWFSPELTLTYKTENGLYDFSNKKVIIEDGKTIFHKTGTINYKNLPSDSEFKSDYIEKYTDGYYIKTTKAYHLNNKLYAYVDLTGKSYPGPDKITGTINNSTGKPVSGDFTNLLGNLPVASTEKLGIKEDGLQLKITNFGINSKQLNINLFKNSSSLGKNIYSFIVDSGKYKSSGIYSGLAKFLNNEIKCKKEITPKLYTFLSSSCAQRYKCKISDDDIVCDYIDGTKNLYSCLVANQSGTKIDGDDSAKKYLNYSCNYNVVECADQVTKNGYNAISKNCPTEIGKTFNCSDCIEGWDKKDKCDNCRNKCKVVAGNNTSCYHGASSKLAYVVIEDNCEDSCKDPIYRQIDLKNPFASISGIGRLTGSNWCTSTSCANNKENQIVNSYILKNRGTSSNNVYMKNPLYVINLNASEIQKIRKYNKTHAYDEYDLNCTNGQMCFSKFLRNTVSVSGSCSNAITSKYYSCADKENVIIGGDSS